jgi:primosomal protein N' (replication factor Y) (superfamily II helicase)
LLIKAKDRRTLNQMLQQLRTYALDHKWNATALVIDVDPLTLL